MSGSDGSRLIVTTEETPRSANEPPCSSLDRALLPPQPGAPSATSDLWPTSISKAGWRALFASWLGWMFDGYETYAFVLVMGIAVPQLLPAASLPNASIYMGGLLSVTLLGWAVGGVVAGVFADYIGRRRTLMISILCYAFFAGLTALSWSYASLLVFRFFTGLGLGAEWGPGAAIVAEFWPPASRGRAAGALHSAYGFGLLLAAGIWLLLSPLGPSACATCLSLACCPLSCSSTCAAASTSPPSGSLPTAAAAKRGCTFKAAPPFLRIASSSSSLWRAFSPSPLCAIAWPFCC